MVATNRLTRSRSKKFLSFYRPYLGLFFADMACAFIVSAVRLILPLCASYITKNVLASDLTNALPQIYAMGTLMLALVIIHTGCILFVDYRGHMMGRYAHGVVRPLSEVVVQLLR